MVVNKMIKLVDYEKLVSNLERGDTVRTNHIDCPAGTDTRRRLYLTRPAASAGIVLGFCHNCQESGVCRDQVGRYRDFDPSSPSVKTKNFEVPNEMEPNPDMWPQAASHWRVAKGLTKTQCIMARIQYDPSSHRIYLPMYNKVNGDGSLYGDGGSTLMGFQLRQIDSTGPKYYTALLDSNTKPHTRLNAEASDLCVLVEDLASGLAITNACRGEVDTVNTYTVSVLVNYGIKVSIEALADNVDCKSNLVWLDNDGTVVEEQAITIARTWALLTNHKVHRESLKQDPKNLTNDQLLPGVRRFTRL